MRARSGDQGGQTPMRREGGRDGSRVRGFRGQSNPPPSFSLCQMMLALLRPSVCFIGRMAGLVFLKLVFGFLGHSLQKTLVTSHVIRSGRASQGSAQKPSSPGPGGTVTQASAEEPSPSGRVDPVCVCSPGCRSLSLLGTPSGTVWWLPGSKDFGHYPQSSMEELPCISCQQ